ncbi:GMC oxidoreductase [Trametes sanguinea]|nr:GMC oxidoreductase [Trametes sanguinea]
MGATHSAVVKDPQYFATKVDEGGGNEPWKSYDYVIVGGGTAGCILASRLSEDRNATVLLLEAGKSHRSDISTRIPLGFSKILRTSSDWNTETIPQPGLQGRKAYIPRGKILGGSSSTNALIYHHSSPEDFDEWVSLGATGWSYDDLRPYFKKAEKYNSSPEFPHMDAESRGRVGPLQTSHPKERAPIIDYAVEACKALGIPYSHDINTPRGSLGVTHLVGTLDTKGERSSSATAYLDNGALKRPNLTVATGIMVERVLFESFHDRSRAVGVEFSTSSTSPRYRVRASREVVLSAGAIGTPQILMLSGVGPAEELQKHGIPVVKDLVHVGKHFVDHVSTGPLPFRAKPGLTYDYITQNLHGALALIKWLTLGTGPLSSMAWSSAAFVRSTDPSLPYSRSGEPAPTVKDLTPGPRTPDLELVWFPLTVFDDKFMKPPPGTSGLTLAAILLRPESEGTITLKSRSVWDAPELNPNLLGTENDINTLIRGTRLLMRIARTEPLASVLAPQGHSSDQSSPWWLGDADPDKVTDKELENYLRGSALSAFHPVGTARMGESAETSVVDLLLRVHGVDSLRIVDASVFPHQLSGHPCAVIGAMAEKAVDIIKAS